MRFVSPVINVSVSGFAEWRTRARGLLASGRGPADVVWEDTRARQRTLAECGAAPDFYAATDGAADRAVRGGTVHAPAAITPSTIAVPRAFIQRAELIACHRDPGRWARLYRVLWRLSHGEKHLLAIATDEDISAIAAMEKAVRRDCHKMKAFVRFRETQGEDGERWFVAWFEPEHYIVERVAPFFAARFTSMRWSVLTPHACAHWDCVALTITPGIDRPRHELHEPVETIWRTYYSSIFNPARLKTAAMQREMPKKYWRNLPEAELITGLIKAVPQRVDAMLEAAPSVPRKRLRVPAPVDLDRESAVDRTTPASLFQLRLAAATCRRCPLWENATQTVFGEGNLDAEIMLVGEQPGDEEDIKGRTFVGPAGRLLDRALRDAGINRSQLYLTNAVKHFKWTPGTDFRGKRRLHKSPAQRETDACHHWLESEIAALKPRVIVCLGATAARAVLGRPVKISAERGRLMASAVAPFIMITAHPSAILRTLESERASAYRLLVDDFGLLHSTGMANPMPAPNLIDATGVTSQ